MDNIEKFPVAANQVEAQADKESLKSELVGMKAQLSQLTEREEISQFIVDRLLNWGTQQVPAPIPPGSLFELYGASANDLGMIEIARANLAEQIELLEVQVDGM